MTDSEKRSKQLEKVASSLQRVPPEIHEMVTELARTSSEDIIIGSFNQHTLDLFTLIPTILKEINKESDIKFGGYKLLLENALKMNKKMPADHFTLYILEFAPEIYLQEESFFLDKHYGEATLSVGNEFSFISSDPFKKIWKTLNDERKNRIKEKFMSVTIYAHAFFMKTLMGLRK